MPSKKSIDLSVAQRQVLDEMFIFALNRTEFAYIFSGVAGSGKTTILKIFYDCMNKISVRIGVGAFTGKAASVMRKKGLHAAKTIHSMIYVPVIDEKTHEILEFRLKTKDEVECDIFLLDEASMLTENLFEDVASLGIPMIMVGDKEQLKMSDTFCIMDAHDFHLEEIFRQDEASDIIKLSKSLRETGQWGSGYDPNEVLFVKKHDVNKAFIQKHKPDIIITGTNQRRKEMNRLYRAAMGFVTEIPVKGERVMCLKNHGIPDGGTVFNGEIYEIRDHVFEDTFRERDRFSIAPWGQGTSNVPMEVEIEQDTWITEQVSKDGRQDGMIPFTFGNAATCHKLQGSEFDTVLLMDEDVSYFASQKAYRYTGITRAAKRVIVAI